MRRVLKISAVAALGAVLAACASTPAPLAPVAGPPPPPPPPPTPAEEFAWSTTRGANTLSAQIAYQPAAGQQWTCNGLAAALMPETSYSRGRMQVLYGSADRSVQTVAQVRARSAANPGPDYSQFVRSATCDAQDSFTFPALPNGAYFIIARARQVRPVGATGEVAIMQRIEIGGGQAIRIFLPQGGARPAAAPPAPPPPARPAAPARR